MTVAAPAALEARFPGRRDLVKALAATLVDHPSPPSVVWVSGPTATGKTALCRAFLETHLPDQSALVRVKEAFTARHLAELLTAALAALPTFEAGPRASGRAEERGVGDLAAFASTFTLSRPTVLLIDAAEALVPLGTAFLRTLFAFLDFTPRLTLLCTSQQPWRVWAGLAGLHRPTPLLLATPRYSTADLKTILALDRPTDVEAGLFESFIDLLLDVFGTACRDLGELRFFVETLFPKYIEPILEGRLQAHESSKLYIAMQPHFKQSLHVLFRRQGVEDTGIKLPLLHRYMLLASFIASYNHARTDRMLFEGASGGRRVPKRRRTARLDPALLGPKVFTVERLFSIFYAIFPQQIEPTLDLSGVWGQLAEVQFLETVSLQEGPEGAKLRCLIGDEVARAIAASVGFDLSSYLIS